MAKQLSALETIKRNLGALDRDELGELAALVGALLAIPAADEPETDEAGADKAAQGDKEGAGWIEWKLIGGCGPYAYQRWRDDRGRLRSKYLGKTAAGAAVVAQ